jgi:nucleoside-diphosphate-sugar epimerase
MDRLIHDVYRQRHYTRFPLPGRTAEVYVEDLAEMIWLASHHPAAAGETFFVGNPEPVRIANVYPELARVLGVPYKPMDVPENLVPRYRDWLYRLQPDNLMLRILFEDYFYCATDKWHRLTGYRPTYGYQEGMARTVHWYRKHGLLEAVCKPTS